MCRQRPLRSAMTTSACDVKIPFLRMSKKTAREVGSISARVWNIVDIVRKGGVAAVRRDLALLCAVVVRSES